MNINLITDAKYHNLALMKISTWQKANGHTVHLNGVGQFDMTIGSWLFDWSIKQPCDLEGGPGIDPKIKLPDCLNSFKPDYDLFPIDYSLGYTWAYCPRKCPFCIVPLQHNPKEHHSIWEFHDSRFKKICLLNNNTFSDPQWRETFEEIWEADLAVRDENGYDLRFMDNEKVDALHKTKWATPLHFAWDQMKDEAEIIRGLKLLSKYHLRSTSNGIYVLIGFNTTRKEDIYRCQIINDYGLTPYPMPYVKSRENMVFKRFINLHYYRQYKTIEQAWKNYKKGNNFEYPH